MLYRNLTGLLGRQEFRYLIAGGWNAMFGPGCFFLLYWLLQAHVHYMAIALLANILAVTVAYMLYKWFVFQTRGNIIREYLRFYGVYGVSILFSLAALPFCIEVLHLNIYVSQSLVLAFTAVCSFIGHKRFSFAQQTRHSNPHRPTGRP